MFLCFSRTLKAHHRVHLLPCYVVSPSVCLLVTRVYCDKTAKARIMQFHLKVKKYLNFSMVYLTAKFAANCKLRDLSLGGLKLGWGCFQLPSRRRRKQRKIETRSQLITNRIWAFICGLFNCAEVDDFERPFVFSTYNTPPLE